LPRSFVGPDFRRSFVALFFALRPVCCPLLTFRRPLLPRCDIAALVFVGRVKLLIRAFYIIAAAIAPAARIAAA